MDRAPRRRHRHGAPAPSATSLLPHWQRRGRTRAQRLLDSPRCVAAAGQARLRWLARYHRNPGTSIPAYPPERRERETETMARETARGAHKDLVFYLVDTVAAFSDTGVV